MKKITLISILSFLLITGALVIANIISPNIASTTSIPTTTAITDSQNNLPTNNQSPKNNVHDLNLNISQLIFNSGNSSTDTITMDEIAKHDTRNDCYLVINNKVYDVSKYINHHPGGSSTITSRCGKEVTGIFARIHSNRAWDLLKEYKVGTITTNKTDTTPQTLNAIGNALKDANPGIKIIKVSPKKDSYIAKLIFNKKLYEVHINNMGQIVQEEVADDESDWSLWENDTDDK